MWKKHQPDDQLPNCDYKVDDFKTLLRYINHLASHKLGYPVSLLTYLGIVNNNVLGIKQGSIANILLNNVGDPFKDSETSLLEVKKHEREVLNILEHYYGMEKGDARGYVTTGGTEGNFAGLWWSKRYVINRGLESLSMYDDKVKLLAKEEQDLSAELAKIPLNSYAERAEHLQKIINCKNEIATNKNIVQQLLTPTVFYSKGSTHYSVPKISEILHLNIRAVTANPNGSMNVDSFYKEMLLHLGAHPFSPIIFVGNIGTTITGAIDDIPALKKILDTIRPNLNYTIHLDGALTGFVLPILKPFGDIKNYFKDLGVNTLSVSAHKYPGLSQPCGIILAEREFYDMAFSKSERSVEYVGNILDVTITGSRSGLNVLMFYHALATLGLNKGNKILIDMVNLNMKNAKYLYDQLVSLYGLHSVSYPFHFNVTFPKPSKFLAKKYQLMVTGNSATICVLANVDKKLIDKFVSELKLDKEIEMKSEAKINYTIKTLESEHVKSTIDLFIRTFCDYEPITKHLKISHDEYEPFARAVVQKAVKDGLSKVAIDENQKVIAFNLSEDLINPFVADLSQYPKMAPVIGIIQEVTRPNLAGKVFLKGKVLHPFVAGIDPAYQGHGLSTIINLATLESAAQKGFEFVYVEFTNEPSEKSAFHFKHYKALREIKYEDYVFEGTKPFASVPGRIVAYVVAIQPHITIKDFEKTYKLLSPEFKLDLTEK